MQSGFAVVAHPLQDLLVGLHIWAWGELTGAVLGHRVGGHQLTRLVHSLDPFAAVLFGAQIVKQHLWLNVWVSRLDAHPALGIGEHWADVPLETMLDLGRGAVVTHRHWQEVEHQVRVFFVVVGAHEAAGLKVGGCHWALVG